MVKERIFLYLVMQEQKKFLFLFFAILNSKATYRT